MRSRTAIGGLGVIALLAATACGGSSGQGSSGGDGAIRIGMIAPRDAAYYSVPYSIDLAKAAVAAINKDGGIGGRNLELVWCNEANDANKATECARKLVEDGVVATVASVTITAGAQVMDILGAAKVANVGWVPLSKAEYTSPTVFSVTVSDVRLAAAAAAIITHGDATKTVMVTPDSSTMGSITALVRKAVTGAGGTFSEADVKIPRGAVADYAPFAKSVIDSGADLVVAPVVKSQLVGVTRALRQLGSTVKVVGEGDLADADIADLGPDAQGLYTAAVAPWVHDAATFPAITQVADALGAAGMDMSQTAPNYIGSYASVLAVAGTLRQMAKAGTTLDAADFLGTFGKATDVDTGGLLTWSPATSENVVPGYGNVASTTIYVLTGKDGKLALAYDKPSDLREYLK